ncbi:MAG: Ig-like domain-containing protein, partial [Candidatus Methylomirabilales bacterium]
PGGPMPVAQDARGRRFPPTGWRAGRVQSLLRSLPLLSLVLLLLPTPAIAPTQPSGQAPLELLLEGFQAPTGLAVAPDGTLFFTDEKEGSLFQHDPDGILTLLGDRLKKPRGLTRAADGTLFLLAERLREQQGPRPRGLLLKRSPDGTLTILASGFDKPQQLIRTPEGNLFLSTRQGLRQSPDEDAEDNDDEDDDEPPGFPGTLFRVSPKGQLLQAHPGFRRPSGLVLFEDGTLTVAAEGFSTADPPLQGSLFQLDPAGAVTVLLPERFPRPTGLVQDVLGQVYLAVKGERQEDDERPSDKGLLLKVAPDGSVTRFAQGFARPWGLALDAQGNLYVSDPPEGRIFRFLAPPPPTLALLPAATNQPTVTLTGTTEPEAQITVRGGQEEVRTIADADGDFTLDVPLQPDQLNALTVFATGRKGEGLTSAPAPASILQDRTPPTVAFRTPAAGSRLTGPVTVEITAEDTLSGIALVQFLVDDILQGSGTAPPFTFPLDPDAFAPGPHTLTARAEDQAGNQATVSILVILSSLQITIREPANGATVPAGPLVVRGTVDARGVEVGVTVNGLPAAVQGSTFAALVPVTKGTTNLTAVGTTAAGDTASDTIALTVTPAPEPAFTLHVSPASGVAPLTVTFLLIGDPVPTAINLDLEGNGTVDFTGPSLEGQTFTYAQPGLFFPTVTGTDAQGSQFTARAVVQVDDRTALDALLQAKWTGMKAALQQGDTPAALQFITSQSRGVYQELFNELAPILSTVGTNLDDIRIVEVREDLAEYELLVVEDGQSISYYIEFIRDTDGLWRVNFF